MASLYHGGVQFAKQSEPDPSAARRDARRALHKLQIEAFQMQG